MASFLEKISDKVGKIEFEPPSQFYDYENTIHDYTDLDEVNKSIKEARLALFRVTDEINKEERKALEAKDAYDKAYRRYYLKHSEIKPEAARRFMAECAIEEIYDIYQIHSHVAKELDRMAFAIRTELQALQSLSNNIRLQVKG